MNKQLIKTYFEEFKYWLDGGKLQAKFVYDQWEKAPKDIFSYSMVNFILVIDDEYVEFRKALAEGKEVEYLSSRDTWENLKENCIIIDAVPVRDLRIKPDVPKFKVGDWVVHNGIYKRVTKAVDDLIDSLDNQVAVIMKEESLELWKPKKEEYFWFMNDLVKFHETQTNAGILLHSARGCSYYQNDKDFGELCEPFIGELPSNLKQEK